MAVDIFQCRLLTHDETQMSSSSSQPERLHLQPHSLTARVDDARAFNQRGRFNAERNCSTKIEKCNPLAKYLPLIKSLSENYPSWVKYEALGLLLTPFG